MVVGKPAEATAMVTITATRTESPERKRPWRNRGRFRYSRTYCRWVVDDSIPWKDELVKIADRLEAKTKQTRWTDRTGYLIERDFMVSAYALRKLIESHKVSDRLGQRHIPVRRYDQRGNPPDPLYPADITDSYDFENGRRRTLSVVNLCHEIVHSCVFTFCCGETTDLFDGIYVSADRHKNRYVYLVLASDFIALCYDAGAEEDCSESWVRDSDDEVRPAEILVGP